MVGLVPRRSANPGHGTAHRRHALFFRREIETNEQLFRGVAWAKLEHLSNVQEAGLAELQETLALNSTRLEALLTNMQVQWEPSTKTCDRSNRGKCESSSGWWAWNSSSPNSRKTYRRWARRSFRPWNPSGCRLVSLPQDSISIRSDGERQLLCVRLARFRALPEEECAAAPSFSPNAGGNSRAPRRIRRPQARTSTRSLASSTTRARRARPTSTPTRQPCNMQLVRCIDGAHHAVKADAKRFAPFPVASTHRNEFSGPAALAWPSSAGTSTGRSVVVKAIQRHDLDRDIDMVFTEAQLLRQLDHPCIIRVQDCDFVDKANKGLTVSGHGVFRWADAGGAGASACALAVADAVVIARLIASALQAAHAQGVLHRDVKPANVLVRRRESANGGGEWEAKLIDFGLAMRHEALRSTLAVRPEHQTAAEQSIVGTLHYAAPEQMGQLPGTVMGPYSDIYGLAKTCCYALFQTTQPLLKHWKSIPVPLAELLERCLSEQPNERPGIVKSFSNSAIRCALEARVCSPPPCPCSAKSVAGCTEARRTRRRRQLPRLREPGHHLGMNPRSSPWDAREQVQARSESG